MDNNWYIQESDKKLGPYDLSELKQLISAKMVPHHAKLGREGTWFDLIAFEQKFLTHDDKVEAPKETEVQPQPASTTSQANLEPPPLERDAILLLGRRRAGKTIYLAALYSKLWKAVNGLTMRALSGPNHTMLMGVWEQLRNGEWPEATLGARQLEFEIEYDRRNHLLVAFDYSGEAFRQAFLSETTDSSEVKKLLEYVDRAAAVILLLDPSVVVEGKYDEVADDDFGMVQAVQRIRNWTGGEEVPVVLALTKADRNKDLLLSHGSAKEFVKKYYPALVRTLKRIAIFPLSAIQENRTPDGKSTPSRTSVPFAVEKPLLYCLDELEKRAREKEALAAQQAAEAAHARQIQLEAQELASANRRLWIYVTSFIVLSICGLAVMYMLLSK